MQKYFISLSALNFSSSLNCYAENIYQALDKAKSIIELSNVDNIDSVQITYTREAECKDKKRIY